MKLLLMMSLQSKDFKSTSPRYLTSTVSARESEGPVHKVQANIAAASITESILI
jgi:hypothetical protein